MCTKLGSNISRRRFLTSTSVATTVALVAPCRVFAQQDEGLVQTARKTAATAPSLSKNFGPT
jgi:hypothetical protein